MKRLSVILSTIHKSFVRPILDYADIIYDKPVMNPLKENLKQYSIVWLSLARYVGLSGMPLS